MLPVPSHGGMARLSYYDWLKVSYATSLEIKNKVPVSPRTNKATESMQRMNVRKCVTHYQLQLPYLRFMYLRCCKFLLKPSSVCI